MHIAKRSRLAVAALLELARHAQPLPLPQLSRQLRVSVSGLEAVFGRLRRHGLVHGARGPGGGYRLARRPAAISVLDVVSAVDTAAAEPSHARVRGLPAGLAAVAGRIDSDWWRTAEQAMAEWLAAVSLHDLAEADRCPRRLALTA
jgi:Rrf2 family iron-sulfur cluster assembly transcriptional regulator